MDNSDEKRKEGEQSPGSPGEGRRHEYYHSDHGDHDHDHGDPDPNSSTELEARTRAIQSLLAEKGIVSVDAVETTISSYEEDVGPQNGARVVAKAWTNPSFKRRLLNNADAAIAEFDFDIGDQHIEVVENTRDEHNVTVCTLCSCYPWSLLGLPPTWYKSPEYRSRMVREPRSVLREFGLDLPDSVDIHVWDATSDLRYLVLPRRPPETEGDSEAELADLVTRDAMVGVERLITR
ncbi:nitrile hydratase subunit alpha [Saliphagus sp. GCM10025334]